MPPYRHKTLPQGVVVLYEYAGAQVLTGGINPKRIAHCILKVMGWLRPLRDHRQVVERIVRRCRCGIARRDLPERFGAYGTVVSIGDPVVLVRVVLVHHGTTA